MNIYNFSDSLCIRDRKSRSKSSIVHTIGIPKIRFEHMRKLLNSRKLDRNTFYVIKKMIKLEYVWVMGDKCMEIHLVQLCQTNV